MTHGLLLAAGAGRRMGRPKALVRGDDGVPWAVRSLDVLRAGGCADVVVVLGAAAEEATGLFDLLDTRLTLLTIDDWATGMAASLRAGLRHLSGESGVDAALVHLVDLPDVTSAVVARVMAAAAGPSSLVRATYDGRPGHPVLLGRHHWQPIMDTVGGDEGARSYLADHETTHVECGDLASGRDVDRPDVDRPTGNQHRPT